MLKRIKTLLKVNLLIIALSITIGILCLSLIKLPNTGIEVSHIDKGYHSFAYFVLTICWLFAFYKKPHKKYIIIIGCIIFGIVIEILQSSLTMYRTGDFFDVLANLLGVVLALLVFNLIFRKKNIY